MNPIYVKSFADLMNRHATAQIINLLHGDVVRNLKVTGDLVEINPGEGFPIVVVPLSLEIKYEPWSMDRGSLLFEHADYKPFAKICTEMDIIRYPDGSEYSINPSPVAEQVGKTAAWMRKQRKEHSHS